MVKKQWFFGVLFFLVLSSMSGGSTAFLSGVKSPATAVSPVQAWIQDTAIPFRTAEPGGADDDLNSLRQIVGSTPIVGLGEATHGTHEFFAMKVRIVEYLVSHMGFTTVAMENNWANSQQLNSYITTGVGDIQNVMQSGLFQSWQTQEYQSLFEWLRAYNLDPIHKTKVQFVGFDCQGIGQTTIDTVLDYLQKVDGAGAQRGQLLYTGIIPPGSLYAQYSHVVLPNSQKFEQNAQQVYALLQAHQATYVSHSSQGAFDLALQNARVVVQFTTLSATANNLADWYVERDAFMAENLAWIHDHLAGAQPHIVALAHDTHIANITNYVNQHGNFGSLLRKWYGADYLPIGMSFYQGSFIAYDQQYQSHVTPLAAILPGSYNQMLGSVNIPRFILDLRHAPEGPVTTWLKGPAMFQTFGLMENATFSGSLSADFAVIIHFQHTTPAHLLGGQYTVPAQPVVSHAATVGKQANYLWIVILAAFVLCVILAGLAWVLMRRQQRRRAAGR